MPLKSWLQRLFDVRRDEVLPVCLAVLFFFCVLVALMILRPAREALGLRGGLDAVRWLFMGTALAALLVNPLFGWLVSRLPRLQFISATYAFFASSLVGFYLLLVLTPEAVGVVSGQVFYVWFSVFNLFATMVFWALMADRFSLEQGKRFFGLIAVGGTLGAIAGPWLASRLAAPLGTPALLLVSAAFLAAGLAAAWGIARVRPASAGTMPDDAGSGDDTHAPIGGSAWAGMRAVFASRYLLGMAAYVVILAVMATFLYFTRLQMVAELGDDLDLRTTMFSRIDLITQVATLLLQALVAGRLMQRIGVPLTLALLPLTTALGFVGLALVGSLAALVAFEAAFRAGGTEVDAVVDEIKPKRTAAELEGVRFDAVLGWFETRYNPSRRYEDRSYNLRLAASKLDGTVLMPGEVFDFNGVVGERSPSELAPVAREGWPEEVAPLVASLNTLLARLDGVDLIEPFHLKDVDGALAMVDPAVIQRLDLTTGGFGVEYAFAPLWTIKAEYLRFAFDDTNTEHPGLSQFDERGKYDVYRIGLNYRTALFGNLLQR